MFRRLPAPRFNPAMPAILTFRPVRRSQEFTRRDLRPDDLLSATGGYIALWRVRSGLARASRAGIVAGVRAEFVADHVAVLVALGRSLVGGAERNGAT